MRYAEVRNLDGGATFNTVSSDGFIKNRVRF